MSEIMPGTDPVSEQEAVASAAPAVRTDRLRHGRDGHDTKRTRSDLSLLARGGTQVLLGNIFSGLDRKSTRLNSSH